MRKQNLEHYIKEESSRPNLEEIKKSKHPISKLIDVYIDLKYGISRRNYLKKESRTVKHEKRNVGAARSWFKGTCSFPLKYLKCFLDELQIPLEEVIAVKGKDPFKADIEEFKKSKHSISKLIDFYIDLNYGSSRDNYLRKESKTLKQEKLNAKSVAGNWFTGTRPFPLKYLKGFADELQIPLEEVIAVKGKDPFKADIEEFKKSKHSISKLIDFYIDLNYGISRESYLRKESEIVKQEKLNADTAFSWFMGDNHFPLKYLKGFADELQIPLEEVIAVNKGKNPFKPDLENFKKSKSPIGDLINLYINMKYGINRASYLRKESEIVKREKLNVGTADSWFTGYNPFPL